VTTGDGIRGTSGGGSATFDAPGSPILKEPGRIRGKKQRKKIITTGLVIDGKIKK
jgi:hypothetical protein